MSQLPDGPWSVAQGTYDGRALIARVNTGAKAVAGTQALRHRLGVVVLLREPNDEGLPTAEEGAVLNDIEDALCAALRVGLDTAHVLSISTAGVREFVFHTSALDDARLGIASVVTQFPAHIFQAAESDDPNWEVFLEFAEQLSS